jgi:hypothetical protein
MSYFYIINRIENGKYERKNFFIQALFNLGDYYPLLMFLTGTE